MLTVDFLVKDGIETGPWVPFSGVGSRERCWEDLLQPVLVGIGRSPRPRLHCTWGRWSLDEKAG